MKKIKCVFLLLYLGLLVGCSDGIPVLGLDDQGEEQYFFITPSKYSSEMSTLAGEVMTGVDKGMANAPAKSWGVHTVVVGVGVSGEIKAGPLKYVAEPRIRFVFSDKVKPSLP